MRYGQPREIHRDGAATGLWHFTEAHGSDGRRGVFAVGYCADGCPGHDTPEGARDHMTDYLRETALVTALPPFPEVADTQHLCDRHRDDAPHRVAATHQVKNAGQLVQFVCDEHARDLSWIKAGDYMTSL